MTEGTSDCRVLLREEDDIEIMVVMLCAVASAVLHN